MNSSKDIINYLLILLKLLYTEAWVFVRLFIISNKKIGQTVSPYQSNIGEIQKIVEQIIGKVFLKLQLQSDCPNFQLNTQKMIGQRKEPTSYKGNFVNLSFTIYFHDKINKRNIQ